MRSIRALIHRDEIVLGANAFSGQTANDLSPTRSGSEGFPQSPAALSLPLDGVPAEWCRRRNTRWRSGWGICRGQATDIVTVAREGCSTGTPAGQGFRLASGADLHSIFLGPAAHCRSASCRIMRPARSYARFRNPNFPSSASQYIWPELRTKNRELRKPRVGEPMMAASGSTSMNKTLKTLATLVVAWCCSASWSW